MATAIEKTGTVRGIAKTGKWFCLHEDGEDSAGYSVFNPSQMSGLERGDTVEFRFKEKESRGKTYNNIVGQVKITAKGDGGTISAEGGSVTTLPPSGVFGSMTLSRDRSIARQNALKVSAELLPHVTHADHMTPLTIAELVLEMAVMFEAYTTGDVDKEDALQAVEEAELESEKVLLNEEEPTDEAA